MNLYTTTTRFPSDFQFHFMKTWQQQQKGFEFLAAKNFKIRPLASYVFEFEIQNSYCTKMCNSIIHKAWLLLMIIMMALKVWWEEKVG